MSNPTQLDRYKKLLSYIDENFKENINIEKVEDICHYSYRNINRIFEALHGETIGKYVKRLRLEKAAQYLKYSEIRVSDLAYEVGFEDRAAFSKAFKKKYKASPLAFRNNSDLILEEIQQSFLPQEDQTREKLQFDIEFLSDFEFLFLEYRGSYENISTIEKTWDQMINYALKKNLLSNNSVLMTEIIDDIEISESIHSRYNFGIISERPFSFSPKELFRIKKHRRQKYVKFVYQGSDEGSVDFYKKIYALWMLDVNLEPADLPILEFYPNYDENLPKDQLITEIYIPVQ